MLFYESVCDYDRFAVIKEIQTSGDIAALFYPQFKNAFPQSLGIGFSQCNPEILQLLKLSIHFCTKLQIVDRREKLLYRLPAIRKTVELKRKQCYSFQGILYSHFAMNATRIFYILEYHYFTRQAPNCQLFPFIKVNGGPQTAVFKLARSSVLPHRTRPAVPEQQHVKRHQVQKQAERNADRK